MRIRYFAILALLSACAKTPRPEPLADAQIGPAWRIHTAQVEAMRTWNLNGRLAVKTPDDGWTATLQWAQDLDKYQIRVSAPLGQGTVELQGGPEQVTLRAPGDRIATARDPASLMQANLGWSLPLSGLRYWLRGVPEPGRHIDALRLDTRGRMAELQQAGWHVVIDDYVSSGGIDLPARFALSAPRLQVHLVAHEWRTGSG